MPPGALPMPAMAQAHNITHDPFDGAEGGIWLSQGNRIPVSSAAILARKQRWSGSFTADRAFALVLRLVLLASACAMLLFWHPMLHCEYHWL